MSKSLISIIIPAYQCGEYLQPLIESTRLQKVDWEMIVVDVGSNDNTQEVMQGFKKDRRIKYIRTDRRYNANIARNIGLQVARGKYIFIADADSILGEGCLLKLRNKINKGFDFAYCDFSVIEKLGKHIKTGVHICGSFDAHRLCKHNYISIMSMWHRDKLVAMDNTVEKLQDWDMYLEAIEQGLKAGYVEEKLFIVYLRKDGMNKQSDGSWAEIIREKRGIKNV